MKLIEEEKAEPLIKLVDRCQLLQTASSGGD
jgi:hypothetical protein